MKQTKKIELVGIPANWWNSILNFLGLPCKWLVAEFRFTIGAIDDFQEYTDTLNEDIDIDQAFGEMKHLRVFLSILTEYSGRKVEPDSFKFIDFDQVEDVVSLMNEAVVQVGNVNGVAKPQKKRQPVKQ